MEQADLVHVWSIEALEWYRRRSGWTRPRRLLVELDGTRSLSEMRLVLDAMPDVTWLVRWDAFEAGLAAAGVPASRMQRLGLGLPELPEPTDAAPEQIRLVVLSGSNDSEAFFASFWGGLVANTVLPAVRIVPLGTEREVERVRHLAQAARLGHALADCGADPWQELGNCDLLAFAGKGMTELGRVAACVRGGKPLIAGACCGLEEVIAPANRWDSGAGTPSEVARAIVEACEDPTTRQQRAASARDNLSLATVSECARDLRQFYETCAQKKDPGPPRARVLEES